MAKEEHDTLDTVYDELKRMRDEISLKLHLGGMELRDQWEELEGDWDRWTRQLKEELKEKSGDLETRLRETGGEDLRKIQRKTDLAISKLKRGFREITSKLKDD